MTHMKHESSDGKAGSQLSNAARRNKQTTEQEQQQEQDQELADPSGAATELVTVPMTQITLDPSALNGLEAFNPASLLTTASDGSQVMGNFQLQLGDGVQIAGVDPSGTLQLAATQTLQLDEALLQQLQVNTSITQFTIGLITYKGKVKSS